jgi:hypothetical protein
MISCDTKVEEQTEVGEVDCLLDGLDEAETEAIDPQSGTARAEADALQRFLMRSGHDALFIMLHLRFWERLKWAMGETLTNREIATRIFAYLDCDKKHIVNVELLEILGKHLQGKIKFDQKTIEAVEVCVLQEKHETPYVLPVFDSPNRNMS